MTANGKNDIKRFKLVVVGDGACGKTSLLTVFKVCKVWVKKTRHTQKLAISKKSIVFVQS